MKRKNELLKDELRPEYHFDYSKGIRGKYYQRLLKEGANVVVLDPDVAEVFHDSAAVNDVLRSFLRVARSYSTSIDARASDGTQAHCCIIPSSRSSFAQM
jgi:hypothetical protein